MRHKPEPALPHTLLSQSTPACS